MTRQAAGDPSRLPPSSVKHSDSRPTHNTSPGAQSLRVSATAQVLGNPSISGLNVGWQVWSSVNSPQTRNPPTPTAIANELPAALSDATYRSAAGDIRATPRPTSGPRDDAIKSPERGGLNNLDPHTSQSSLSAAQRATPSTVSTSRIDTRLSGPIPEQVPSHLYDSRPPATEQSGAMLSSGVSPPSYSSLAYSSTQQLVGNPSTTPEATTPSGQDSHTFRGMAVKEHHHGPPQLHQPLQIGTMNDTLRGGLTPLHIPSPEHPLVRHDFRSPEYPYPMSGPTARELSLWSPGQRSPQQFDSRFAANERNGNRSPLSYGPPIHYRQSVHNQNAVRGESTPVDEDNFTLPFHELSLTGHSNPGMHPVHSNGSTRHVASQMLALPNEHAPPPNMAYGADSLHFPGSSPTVPYASYRYGLDPYRGSPSAYIFGNGTLQPGNPSLYPGISPMALHQGLYYHPRGPPSHSPSFYYPNQPPMVYPPMPTPLLSSQLPNVHILNGIPEIQQTNFPQQFTQHRALMYAAMQSASFSPPPNYTSTLRYGPWQASMHLLAARDGVSPNMKQDALHKRNALASDNKDIAASQRSPLLEEFRADKTRIWELRDIIGHIYEFSRDQHGSRFIQSKLTIAKSDEQEIVLGEVISTDALQLMQDVFGNYVVQKLFDQGTPKQRTALINIMQDHLVPLSLHMYGCRVVQKAAEYLLPDQQHMFVDVLTPHILECAKDGNGNHAVQKFIQCIAPERLSFVEAFRGNIYDLSTHPYGCRVLQRLLEHVPIQRTRPLVDELLTHSIDLMQNQFGNYVIQLLLEHGTSRDRAIFISKLRGQLLQMARHKYASNVCEKALVTADPESRRLLLDEIMFTRQDGVSHLLIMMKDQYANYVLQRALMVAEGNRKQELISIVKPQLEHMRRYSNMDSKHLISIGRLLET